jgi:hypothetical protein
LPFNIVTENYSVVAGSSNVTLGLPFAGTFIAITAFPSSPSMEIDDKLEEGD